MVQFMHRCKNGRTLPDYDTRVPVPTEDTTGQGKLTVGKLYGGVLIYEIWKTTRFSNLEILAKMEEEMEEKEKLERGEIVEKKVAATPSETKTEKTEESGVTQVTRHTLHVTLLRVTLYT